jgi:hypothetical protein
MIKNQFKEDLGEWTIPENTGKVYDKGKVEFTILRHNNRRIDADSATFAGKYLVDFLVEKGYFSDDNNIEFVYKPAIMNADVVETSLKVEVYGAED